MKDIFKILFFGPLLTLVGIVITVIVIVAGFYAVVHLKPRLPIGNYEQLVYESRELVRNTEMDPLTGRFDVIRREEYPPQIQRLQPTRVRLSEDRVTILGRAGRTIHGIVVFIDEDTEVDPDSEDLRRTRHPSIFRFKTRIATREEI